MRGYGHRCTRVADPARPATITAAGDPLPPQSRRDPRMRLRRAFALGAAIVAVLTGVIAGPTAAQAATATTLASTIALSNCSASLVRYPSSVGSDRAMMLTNGHCYEG